MKLLASFAILLVGMAFPAVGQGESVIETDERVEVPPGLVEKIKEEAGKMRSEPIRKIWIGELAHPLAIWGTRVAYAPEEFGTYAVSRIFSAEIPGASAKKFYSRLAIEGNAFRFSDGPFANLRVETHIVRVFPLKTITLHLPLDDELTYKQVLALLRAIEAGKVKVKDESRISLAKLSASDLPKIISVRKTKDGIEVETETRHLRGHGYTIKIEGDTFILVSTSRWVS